MPVAEVIASNIRREHALERSLASEPSGVLIRFDFYRDRFDLQDSGLKIYERTIGSSFVLAHSEQGKLGSDLSPQPYLGSSIGTWTEITVGGLSI